MILEPHGDLRALTLTQSKIAYSFTVWAVPWASQVALMLKNPLARAGRLKRRGFDT